MRILFVAPTYLPAVRYGGTIYAVHGLARALVKVGHDVHVYTTNVDGPGVSPVLVGRPTNLDGVTLTYFPSRLGRRLYFSPDMGKALTANIAGFDIVHLHSVFLWPPLAGARAARAARRPYVISAHGMLVPNLIRTRGSLRKRAWINLFERKNLKNAAFIHVTSVSEREALSALGLPTAPVRLVPHGIDLPLAYDLSDVSPDIKECLGRGFDILSFGRISWEKGIDRLLRAMPVLPGMRAVIAGNDEAGHAAELMHLADRLAVADRVSFLKRHISGADREALFTNARIFALLSVSENFGNVALEAAVRGVPVVIAKGIGLGDEMQAIGAALTTDPEPQQVAAQIDRLLSDSKMAQSIARSGRTYVLANFAWPKIAEQMTSLYADAIARPALDEQAG